MMECVNLGELAVRLLFFVLSTPRDCSIFTLVPNVFEHLGEAPSSS